MNSLYIDSSVIKSSNLKVDSNSYITQYPVDSAVKKYDDKNGNVKDSVYNEILIINDDGTYSDTIKSHKIGTTQKKLRIITNEWYWTNDKKKKDGIVLTGYGSFKIDKLSWKELDFTYNRSSLNYSNETSKNGIKTTVTKTLKFKRN
jgi:hypothetical protein